MKINIELFEKFRREKNLTKKELAKQIGVSRWTLYRTLKTAKPSGRFLTGFKNAFPEIDIDLFLSYSNSNFERIKKTSLKTF